MPFKDPVRKRERDAAYYLENAERIKASTADYYAENLERGREARRQYRAKNREQLRLYDAARYAADPSRWKRRAALRKARKRDAEGFYTQTDIERIAADQRGRCAYCRTRLGNSRHIDHIMPLSRGGSNWPANLQLLCAPCNLSKQAADPVDFARRIGRLL